MDQVVKSTLTVDKVFLRKERDQYYSDFTIAFWRELFQNSVDARAKRISIKLGTIPARGSFGAAGPEGGTVTNVVFADDGHGMTAEVLGDVYFKMGKSTKDVDDGTMIGGFGRARIMTCFSQERYTILTQDRFVMGDGIHFEHGSVAQQIVELEKYAADLERSSEPGAATSLEGLRDDIDMLKDAMKKNGGYQGCRVEVDLDGSPSKHWHGRTGTFDNMNDALKRYLSESQLACEVSINGQTPEAHFGHWDGKLQARKGPVRRTLYVETPEGPVSFATVHLSEGKKANFKGQLIVRVAGASMFRNDVTGLEAQVIVEIDPAQSRNALNSNRDGLKGHYDRAVNSLLNELAVDTMSALKDKSKKTEVISGEWGKIRSQAPDIKAPVIEKVTTDDEELITDEMQKLPRITSWEALRNVGLHQDLLKNFLEQSYFGDSFLSLYVNEKWYATDDLHVQLRELKQQLYAEQRTPEWFFQNAGDLARQWVLSSLSLRMERVREQWKENEAKRIDGVHDIVISIESANAKTRAAARRHHPENWDETTGAGKAMRSLIAAWTAACRVSMEGLYAMRPALHPISWTTGFVYSLPEAINQGDQFRNVSTRAKCEVIAQDDVRLLINPVNEDGTLRYSLTNEKDLRLILALAKHEVAHLLEISHNEKFANALTDIDAEVDEWAAFKRMKAEWAAVTAAYAGGRARIHPLDREAGPRPAERLLAAACGNDRAAAREAIGYDGDGVYSVDADRSYAIAAGFEEEENNAPTPSYGVGR